MQQRESQINQGNYRVGIAGYGVVGKRRRQFIDAHPRLKVVAVADRSLEKTGEFSDGVRFYANYRDLILKEKLDVLFVCLTNDVAADATVLGLEQGAHVFCEKPPGRDVQDIYRVIQTEQRFPQLKLKYGFNHRYHDSVKDALQILQTQELGRIINLRGVYGKSQILSFQSDWRTKRAIAGGGILLDQGIHMVDLLRLFAGEFSEIHSFISNDFWHHDVEDNAYALMKTPSGVVAFLHSSATQWRHRFHLEMTFEKGSINLAGILSGTKSYGEETITIAYLGEDDKGAPREVTRRYNQDNSWRDEIFEFADSILENKPVVQGSSLEALKTMQLLYRIYCADRPWKDKYQLSAELPNNIL